MRRLGSVLLRWMNCTGLLLLLMGLTVAATSSGQQLAPSSRALAAEARSGLARAATDTRLPPWQRQFMSRLAAGPGESRGSQRARAANAGDGSWEEIVIGARDAHSAIYDPVRDRMLVFGGQDGSLRNDVWSLTLGGSPTWKSLTPSGSPPSKRRFSSAIYDPVGDRMIIFGGLDSGGYENDVWVLTLSGSPAWTGLSPSGLLPSPRELQSAVYDSLRHRMLIFGGFGGSVLRNDVWALSLTGTPAWTHIIASGTAPSGRQGQSAIHDPMRDRMVVFGGYNDTSGSQNDVWALSLAGTPAWTAVTPAGPLPSGRSGHSGIYDPIRDRMLIFGGFGDNVVFGDVWALNLSGAPAWAALHPSGVSPSARGGHSAVYDPVRDGMLVFGGIDGALYNDVWMLAGASTAWSSVVLTPTPGTRQAQSTIYDSVRERILVFGGFDGSHTFYNDVWALALTGPPVWTQLTPAGTPPVAREGHSAIYDPARDRMVVFGGDDGTSARNDVWELALSGTPTWALLSITGPLPGARSGHSAIYDPTRGRMVVFGGSLLDSDTWSLSLTGTPEWTALTPTGGPPPPRYLHSAIYDAARDRMIVFGGNDGSNTFNDVWALGFAAPGWTALTPAGPPPSPRYLHSAIYDPLRDRMVVFSGWDGSTRNDAWALTFGGTPSWSQLIPSGILPAARMAHTCVYSRVRDGMITFGGSNGSDNRNDAWALLWGSPTASVASPGTARAIPGDAIITWVTPNGAGISATVQRRTTNQDWQSIGSVSSDGSGQLTFEDHGVAPGVRYGYRLTDSAVNGAVVAPEVWVDVPPNPTLAVTGVHPNPAVDRLVVTFTLPSDAPARVEVFDLSGRIVLSRQVGSIGQGSHELDLSTGLHLPAGMYNIRLSQSGNHTSVRAVVTH